MAIFTMILTVLLVIGLACVAAVGISFFGCWAWEVIQELRTYSGRRSAHF